MAATIVFNLIQVLPGLTFLSVVNEAFLLFVRKLLKTFCPGHSFESAHGKSSRSVCSESSKCVDV